MRRCEKMSDVRRCEKISHVRRSFICRSIYTSFFLKNPSLRRSREKTYSNGGVKVAWWWVCGTVLGGNAFRELQIAL